MRKFRLGLLVGLGALALPLFMASAAQADLPIPMKSDIYSCVFTGAAGPINAADNTVTGGVGPNDVGIESIAYDINDNGGVDENAAGGWGPLLDEDNGDESGTSKHPLWAGPITAFDDGTYTFATAPINPPPATDGLEPAECLYWSDPDTTIDPPNPGLEAGVTNVHIDSTGKYDNIVCGTGRAYGTATVTETTDGLGNPNRVGGAAAPDPEDPVSASYEIDFYTGQGTLQIWEAANADEFHGTGEGYVNITPTGTVWLNNHPGSTAADELAAGVVPCVGDLSNVNGTPSSLESNNANITQFQASGAFTVVIPEQP